MDGGSRCVLEDGDRSHGGYAANGHGGWIRCPINGVMDGDGVASHNVVVESAPLLDQKIKTEKIERVESKQID